VYLAQFFDGSSESEIHPHRTDAKIDIENYQKLRLKTIRANHGQTTSRQNVIQKYLNF
jgi:hypothetical protein